MIRGRTGILAASRRAPALPPRARLRDRAAGGVGDERAVLGHRAMLQATAAERLFSLQSTLGNGAVYALLRSNLSETPSREREARGAMLRGCPPAAGARVFDDAVTHDWAAGLGARAFSLGSDIFLGAEAAATPAKRGSFLAHEGAHVAQSAGRPGLGVQRATDEEANLSVLRGSLLDELRQARSFSRNLRERRRLTEIESRVGTMSAEELRAAIAEIQPLATRNRKQATQGAKPLTPTSTAPKHSEDDLISDPDRVIDESRNHQVYLLVRLLKKSSVFGARGIRRMLQEMGTDLDHVKWVPVNEAGFAAAVPAPKISGNRAEVTVMLGPTMLMLMNRPDEDVVPTLYHEISHAYLLFRRVARGGKKAVPNLSEREMDVRARQLAGTPFAGDVKAFAGGAVEFARSVESELYAELIEHSALQDPAQRKRGPRTIGLGLPGGGIGTVTLNVASRTEGQIAELLGKLKVLFGDADGGRIARLLAQRADSDPFVHPESRKMFRKLVEQEFPQP